VDLTSNLLVFVPIGGEGIEAAKLAAKAALKLGSRGIVKEVEYDTAVGIVKQLAKRGARGAVEGAAEACALCFPAGTRVATPHGLHAIDTLRVGDTVLSENPTTGKVEAEAVQAVIADPASPLIAVDLSDGSAITVTADHPFWLDRGLMAPRAGWIAAGDLVLGDRLRTPTGTDATVLGVRRGVGRAAVYTLTVAKDHTFFVGTAKVLVHNANCFGIASEIPNLSGKARSAADELLRSRGATVKTSQGGYAEYKFADKSEVYIRPDGEVIRTAAPQYGPDGARINKGQRLDQNGVPLPRSDPQSHNTGERVSE